MSVGRFLQQAAAGNAGEAVYVDDVFSTYLYDGNASSQTINNGIDLDGEGGLTWFKARDDNTFHILFDTERGGTKWLNSASANAESTASPAWITYNSDGFTLPQGINGLNNTQEMASWTFRKQPGFFDVVTYTGNGTSQNINHNLGSVPGMIIVKNRTDNSTNWVVYHRSLNGGTNPEEYSILLNLANEEGRNVHDFNSTAPTSTQFSVGIENRTNGSGDSFVAYLFAHDEQEFGTDSDESIIKCGSYTGNSSTDGPEVDLGFEPQWLMVKNASRAGTSWMMFDVMRGLTNESSDRVLEANASSAELDFQTQYVGVPFANLLPNGFKLRGSNTYHNNSGDTYIYVAIRRPHKPASELEATGVFSVKNYAATTSSASVTHDVVFDAEINANRDTSTAKFHFVDQLRGINGVTLRSSGTSQELSYPTFWSRQNMYTMYAPSQFDAWWASSSGTQNHISYALKRAPGFFDVVAHTSNGQPTQQVYHNLGVTPEMAIIRDRTGANWFCHHKDLTTGYNLILNSSGAEIQSNTTSAASFNESYYTPGNNGILSGGGNTKTYIAYLFATVPGISKVGTYSGTGSDVNVDCGFSSGARMVWVKRADSSGDWFVWDSVRGIVSGNDPYLRLNSETAEVTSTDYIDPLSSGFTITSSAPAELNASGGTYIFLAIA